MQAKQDKLVQKLQEKQEELEQVRQDCQAVIQAYQESQENKAHTLGTSWGAVMYHHFQVHQFPVYLTNTRNIAMLTAWVLKHP